MKRATFSVVMAIVVLGCSVQAVAQEKPSAVGLTIAAPDKSSEFGQSSVMGMPTGVQVYVKIPMKDRYILKVEDEQKPIALADSTGKKFESDGSSNFGFFAQISEDHKSVTVPISASSIPAAGSTFVTVKGELAINCGADSTSETVKLKLSESAEVALGGVKAKIASLGAGFEENSSQVEFESTASFDSMQSLVFLDATGKEFVASAGGSGRSGFGGSVTYSTSFTFNAPADSITGAKVTYFKKVESVKVPLDLEVSLGLSQ